MDVAVVRRADEMVPVVTARARAPPAAQPIVLAELAQPELLAQLLGRLAAASQARYPDVADLSRDLLFHYFDEPLLERAIGAVIRGDGRASRRAARPIRTG